MSEVSERLNAAVGFLKRNGYAKNDITIARKLEITKSTLSMAKSGMREPGLGMLLNFCDIYPINFEWLRTGEGSMVKGEKELELLKKIEQLEHRIKELEKD